LAAAVQPSTDLQTKLGKLQQQADEVQRAQAERDERETERGQITATLEQATYEPEARAEITQLEAERDALGYDAAEHSAHRATLKTYRDYESRHTRLEIAADTLPKLRELQDSQRAHMDTLLTDIAEIDTNITELGVEIARLDELVTTYNERNQQVMALRTAERQANNRVIEAQQALNALAAAREQRKNYEERRADAAEQKAIYDELRQAFGKNGVPAMIIETAIPELQDITNELLSRITDGRMFVKFNMQREKITGGTSETLDIEIADELGTRIYDLYSGGEAFRINFAIRVALSKLLARRAGAHLETLFIDEGFGTQDADGRGKLVEAINAIKDDFALILVITHIEELKDAFPVHINVEKTPRGSQLSLR
jgi:exonuclease SbcC